MKRDKLEKWCFLGALPAGQAFSFWLVSVHHYFKNPSPFDVSYDFEADAAFLGFGFWILFAVLLLLFIDLIYSDESKSS